MFKVGPMGSKIYNSDKSWDEKGHSKISNIYVSFDKDRINSIQFSYFHKGAHLVSQKHRSGGEDYKIVRLKHDEYVTGLSGVDCVGIRNLTFHTNQRKHGPLCATRHTNIPSCFIKYKREIDVEIRDGREFGGFFGSFCSIEGYLTTIGIYVSPITDGHQLSGYQSLDHIGTTTHNPSLDYPYQIPKMVDGFPVNPLGHKPKLKDRILSELNFKKAILLFFRNLLD